METWAYTVLFYFIIGCNLLYFCHAKAFLKGCYTLVKPFCARVTRYKQTLVEGVDVQCDLGLSSDRGSARMFSTAIYETYLNFSYDKDVLIAASDSMFFHLIMLSPLAAIL